MLIRTSFTGWRVRLGRSLLHAAVAVCGIQSAGACGLAFDMPRNHFEGVNEWGYVSIWEDIGRLDLGEGLVFPVTANFRSDRGADSPYLGSGWALPLLECRIVQSDERTFTLTQPNGMQSSFVRKKPADTLLRGSGDWLAQIDATRITAWAACGWKLTFEHGRIESIGTPKNRTIEFIYSGGKVVELRENGAARLTVEFDAQTGYAAAMVYNARRVGLAMGPRPRVQVVSGHKVVGAIDQSLARIVAGAGEPRTFEFGVTESRNPTLKVARPKERLYMWDPGTKRIASDGSWSYSIKPPAERSAFAQISRKNEAGQSEFWFNDTAKGQETARNAANAFSTLTTRFAGPGPLHGKVRKIERLQEGATQLIHSFVYDERGQLLREQLEDGISRRYVYQDGKMIQSVQERAGALMFSRTFDRDGRLLRVVEEDKTELAFKYDERGRELEMRVGGVLHSRKEYAPDGRSMTSIVYQQDGTKPARRFRYEYDKSGRTTSERVSELATQIPDVVRSYQYSPSGIAKVTQVREAIKAVDPHETP